MRWKTKRSSLRRTGLGCSVVYVVLVGCSRWCLQCCFNSEELTHTWVHEVALEQVGSCPNWSLTQAQWQWLRAIVWWRRWKGWWWGAFRAASDGDTNYCTSSDMLRWVDAGCVLPPEYFSQFLMLIGWMKLGELLRSKKAVTHQTCCVTCRLTSYKMEHAFLGNTLTQNTHRP